MRLLDPRNGPDFDLPPCPGARAYVIASTPRSGSTLLARMLWDHGGCGAPKEYLNPMQLRDWEVRFGSPVSRRLHGLLHGPAAGVAGRGHWPDARVDAHLARVRARRSSGGWFGLKLHAHHHARFFAHRTVEDALGPVTWIRIRRHDRLAQAVSWELALQTGRWVAEQRPWRVPIYDRRRITARLVDLDAAEAGWDALLAGREVHEVVYEELAADPAREARRTLDFLGVPRSPLPAPSLRPMGDPNRLAWVERYRTG
ncbi:MAG: sulfotransferase [Alphaproteobacteria bacterium]|nr:sulfotransferase [Alphaproteobacteria bacterium]